MAKWPAPWRFRQGIRGRLLSSYLLLIGLILAILGSAILAGVEWYYRSAITDVLVLRGQADRQFLAQTLQGLDLGMAGQDLVRELGSDLGARIQLYATDGRLVGDSSLPAQPGAQAASGSTVSEVQAALRGLPAQERLEREGGHRVLHLSLPLLTEDGRVAGALRYSTSLAAVDRFLWQVALGLGAVALLALLVTALVGLLLAATLVRPLADLTQVAEAIGSGNLGLRARVLLPDEVGRLAQTLNQMAESLGEVDRLRSDFLRTVSHDLKTPLAAIKAWAVTLQEEGISPEELRLGLTTVEQATDHLARLVEDLLIAARLQAGGQVPLHPRSFDPYGAVQAVCKAMAAKAKAAGVELRLPAAATLPPIHFDPDRFTQVVANLLENAIKFTPAGGRVTVSLTVTPDEVLLQVSDTGPGIDPADLSRLTEPFFRGRSAKGVPGTGLGLTIVSELLQRSGGRMALASRPGEGTQVTLHLPLAKGEIA